MILVEHHRIRPDAGLRAGFVDDAETEAVTPLEVGFRRDAQLRRVIPVPVVEVAQMRVVRLERDQTRGRPEDRREIVDQRGEVGAVVRRGQKQDRGGTPTDGFGIGVAGIVVRLPENLFGQQATEAVADEDDGTFAAETLVETHPVEHLHGAVRERHALPRIAPALADKFCQQAERFARIGRMPQRPDPDIREGLGQPMRPRGVIALAMPPRPERIPAQAVNEHHVRLALRIVASFRYRVQLRHPSPLCAAWPDQGCQREGGRG